MTCIVGMAVGGKLYMGGDSCTADVEGSMEKSIRKDAKVFETRDMLIGYSGSWRFGQIIRWIFDPPAQKTDQEDLEYLVTDWVAELKKTCNAEGYSKIENNEETMESTALLGYKGKLYVLDGDWNIGEPAEDYAALGAGSAVAMGAMFATFKASKSMTPKARLEVALQAASEYIVGISPPYIFLSK